MAKTYGDVVVCKLAGTANYLFFHPADVHEFMCVQHRRFVKGRILQGLDEILGQGLTISDGPLWKRHRQLAAPALQPKAVAAYAPMVVRHAARRFDSYANGDVRCAVGEMKQIALAVVAEALLGIDMGEEAPAIAAEVEIMQRYFLRYGVGWLQALPRWLPTPLRQRFRQAMARFDARIYRFIAERRITRAEDLLSRLIVACDEGVHGLDDKQLRDQVTTLLIAGYDTTALSLTFALYLLSQHPEILDRVAREVRTALGEAPPQVEDAAKLPLTEAVIKEAMRLFPPAYLLSRDAAEACEIGRVTVPAGASVTSSLWVIHRDPRWYDEPERFRPERWLDGLESRLPRCAYIPFGAGPRICIGQHLAMLESVLVLAVLLQRFDIQWAGDGFEVESMVTLQPKGTVPIRFTRARST